MKRTWERPTLEAISPGLRTAGSIGAGTMDAEGTVGVGKSLSSTESVACARLVNGTTGGTGGTGGGGCGCGYVGPGNAGAS